MREIDVSFIGYASKVDTSRVIVDLSYTVISFWSGIISGAIKTPFSEDFFRAEDNTFQQKTVKGILQSVKLMEHSCNGRTNLDEYDSMFAYVSDPKVQKACIDWNDGVYQGNGMPHKVDNVYTFTIEGAAEVYTLAEPYGEIPYAWIREIWAINERKLSE